MDFKKTIKYDGKIKGLHIVDGELVNLDGEIIDIISILERVYGEKPFDLSTTTKTEESINPDQLDKDSE
jgi:gamma-glutamylcyclotransferase (GGCT)/AIG2-like uncharacterized protein YtfP